MYTYIYVYIYIHIHIYVMYICIYIYTYVHDCVADSCCQGTPMSGTLYDESRGLPKVLFGDQSFGVAADAWSLGLVLCELAGSFFHKQGFAKMFSQVDYMMAIFKQLGTPAATSWPLWPRAPPQFRRQPWADSVVSCLGIAGVALADAWLEWLPDCRLSVSGSGVHAYFHPEHFGLGGEPWQSLAHKSPEGFGPEFQGSRHSWNVRVGTCSPEVLLWLRADPVLQVGTAEHDALGLDFNAAGSNVKSEQSRKFILSGAVGSCSSGAMCGLSLDRSLPFRRLLAWHQAFLHVNCRSVADLGAAARVAIGRIGLEERGTNGQHVMDTPVQDWFLTCGELNISNAGSEASSQESSGPWEEPLHQDGGASILHMGLTVYGRRDVRFIQGPGLADVAVRNVPGTVYFGQVTGAEHQVHHRVASSPSELLHLPGFGQVSVTVMLRTALFPYNRARMRNTTPSPVVVFHALARSFRESCARGAWRFPSLAECETELLTVPVLELGKAKGSEKRNRLDVRGRSRAASRGRSPAASRIRR